METNNEGLIPPTFFRSPILRNETWGRSWKSTLRQIPRPGAIEGVKQASQFRRARRSTLRPIRYRRFSQTWGCYPLFGRSPDAGSEARTPAPRSVAQQAGGPSPQQHQAGRLGHGAQQERVLLPAGHPPAGDIAVIADVLCFHEREARAGGDEAVEIEYPPAAVEGRVEVAAREFGSSDDLAGGVDGIADAEVPAEGAEVLQWAAVGARQERVARGVARGVRISGDLAGSVDAKATAESPAEGAEVLQRAAVRARQERVARGVARGVRASDDLAGGVDGNAEAVGPAEGAEVLQRAAVGARQERVARGVARGVRISGDLAGGVDAKAGAESPAEGAEVLQRAAVGARQERVARAARGVRASDDLAGGVDGRALAAVPAEGAEVLQRAAVGARQERVELESRRGVRISGDLSGGVDGKALADVPPEGAEVLQGVGDPGPCRAAPRPPRRGPASSGRDSRSRCAAWSVDLHDWGASAMAAGAGRTRREAHGRRADRAQDQCLRGRMPGRRRSPPPSSRSSRGSPVYRPRTRDARQIRRGRARLRNGHNAVRATLLYPSTSGPGVTACRPFRWLRSRDVGSGLPFLTEATGHRDRSFR